MDYELYHDESQEHGYWHGMLLVPIITKQLIVEQLEQVRKHTNYKYPLSFKRIEKLNRVFSCAEAWLDIAIGSMITKFNLRLPHQVFTGEKKQGRKQYAIFDHLVKSNPIGVKFILFRDKDRFIKMSRYPDYGAKVETSFRIGLKGGLHFLFSEVDYANIIKIHFDGHEHYQRNINQSRITDRLTGLRDYCKFENSYIIDDESSDHFKEKHQGYDDCQFLQLTDLLVGAFRTAFGFCGQGNKVGQKHLAEPVKTLIERYKEGYARMQNSRWKNSFCMSESFIEDGTWKFQSIEYNKSDKKDQLALFE